MFAFCSLYAQHGYVMATTEGIVVEKEIKTYLPATSPITVNQFFPISQSTLGFPIHSYYDLEKTISEEKSKEIDSYIQYIMEDQKIPGLALAITHNGEVQKKKTYGLASIEYNVPVSDSSVFWIASISKHITCTAIMLLAQDGIIDIDDKINEYLPDTPDHWQDITIRHLMTHTSGLPESGKGSERGERSVKGTYSAEEMFNYAKKDSLAFQPGTDFLYSDEGIFLLGYLIHKISGMSFKEFMQKRIFDPSGMNTAYLMDHFEIHPNQVTGYAKKDGLIIPDRNYWRLLDTEINAAGGVYASIDDMINWEKTLLGDLLTPESKRSMWTPHSLNDGNNANYGFGWNAQSINGEKIIYHPGVAGTEFLRFLDNDISIIVLTNQADYQRSIAHKISEILEISPEKGEDDFISGRISKQTPHQGEIEKMVGEYLFIPNGNFYLDDPIEIRISAEKDQVWIEFPTNKKYHNKYKMVKIENGKWVQLSWDPVATEFTYDLQEDKDGAVTISVFENYGPGISIHIGELKRRDNETIGKR